MKKSIAVLLTALSVLLAFAGCGEQGQKDVYKIGISQFAEHPALDQAYRGFVDGLKENGFEEGKNVEFDFNLAQGDIPTATTIANKLVNGKVDLIYAIATPSAVAAAQATKDIPIVISAVTDPVDAKLVQSAEKPGTNVTGTSDLAPVKAEIELIKRILPNAKTIGFIYNSGESNSRFIVEQAKAEAEAKGYKTVVKTVSALNEITQVTQALVKEADVVYIPNDNMFASAMSSVVQVTDPAKVPVFPAEKGMMDQGGLATYETDYYQLGKISGEMAAKILKGEAKPQEMAVQYQKEFKLAVNTDVASRLNINIPEEVMAEYNASK